MDGLTLQIINGNRKAIKIAKTCITTPTLINLDYTQGTPMAIPLDCETNQKSASAEVSESLIIASETKKNVTDNVAPGSKSWSLSGYIIGSRRLEPTNYFQPIMQHNVDVIWEWFESGAVLVFKDGDSHIHERVVIKDLKTSQQKDCANGVPFTLTLKELNVMEMNLTQLFGIQLGNKAENISKVIKSIPRVGSILSFPFMMGATTSSLVDDGTEDETSA